MISKRSTTFSNPPLPLRPNPNPNPTRDFSSLRPLAGLSALGDVPRHHPDPRKSAHGTDTGDSRILLKSFSLNQHRRGSALSSSVEMAAHTQLGFRTGDERCPARRGLSGTSRGDSRDIPSSGALYMVDRSADLRDLRID